VCVTGTELDYTIMCSLPAETEAKITRARAAPAWERKDWDECRVRKGLRLLLLSHTDASAS